MAFKKKIKDKVYVVGEPTLRQNKDFFKICIDNNISFEKVSQNFDFGRFIVKIVEDDLLEQMLAVMIQPQHGIYQPDQLCMEDISSFTETEIKEIFDEFFLKKKALIDYFLKMLKGIALKMMAKHLKTIGLQTAMME